MPIDSVPTPEKILAMRDEFIELCNNQMAKGEEYEVPGEVPGWLKNDLFRYIYEELADIHNYAFLLFSRLRLIEEELSANGIHLSPQLASDVPNPKVSPASGSFVSSAEVSGFKPDVRGS